MVGGAVGGAVVVGGTVVVGGAVGGAVVVGGTVVVTGAVVVGGAVVVSGAVLAVHTAPHFGVIMSTQVEDTGHSNMLCDRPSVEAPHTSAFLTTSHRLSGIVPVRALYERSKSEDIDKLPKDDGMVPLSKL